MVAAAFVEQLLAGDGPNEGGKMIGSLRGRQTAGPMLSNQVSQDGITPKQEPARTGVILGFHGNPIV